MGLMAGEGGEHFFLCLGGVLKPQENTPRKRKFEPKGCVFAMQFLRVKEVLQKGAG